MLETEAEIEALQVLLDHSHRASGAHLSSIVTRERRLNARQIVNYLVGVKHVAFGTVNSRGEPMVAPVDGWFVHGQFVVSTAANAVRARHIERNPAVSLAHVVGDDIGIWAHGRARALARGGSLARDYDRLSSAAYGGSVYDLGEIAVWAVEARVMFAYAPDPSKYP